MFMKEFLSCVREFDIWLRHKVLNSPNVKKGKNEAFFLKPNFMSLSNLLWMMAQLGPLVECWDGGGKGEKLIQVVKPHIKRGVRDDTKTFFVNLVDKIYKGMQLDLLEILYGVKAGISTGGDMEDVLDKMKELMLSETEDDTTTQPDEESDDEEEGTVYDDAQFSTNGAVGMTKKKTIYVYPKQSQLQEALLQKKPIAGYVEVNQSEGKTAFEFRVVY